MLKKLSLKLQYLLYWGQKKLSPKQFLFLSSVLVGLSSAFAVIVLKAFAHSVYSSASYINGILKLSFLNLILPVIGIMLTVFVVMRLLGGTIEKGTSQILYAVARKGSYIPKKQMYAQIITSSLTVGLGGSAGLESPIVVTGAAFGANYAQQFKLGYQGRTLLIGCGVAAGIAAAFNAPIAGVLFAIEVLLVDVTISAFTPIMIAAATGSLVSTIVLNENILLSFRGQQTFDYHNIPFYVLLGIFTGLLAVFYFRNFLKAEHYFAHLKLSIYKKAFIGASLLALMIFLIPTLFGEGYESIKTLADKDPGLLLENTLFGDFRNNSWMLLIFVGFSIILKAFASGITLGSGGNGGNFAPSLFLGSYAGFFFSKVLNLLNLTNLPVSNFAIVGMAGILSGLFHAPLTAIFLIAEITSGYDLMIPLMIVASVSYAVSKRFESHSLDVKNLAGSGNAFTSNKDTNILWTLDIKDFIKTDYVSISQDDDLKKLASLIVTNGQLIFPVLSEDKKLDGIVYFKDIRKIIFEENISKELQVKDCMEALGYVVNRSDNMETIMDKFEKSKKEILPVVINNEFCGFVDKSTALEAYRNKLKSMTFD